MKGHMFALAPPWIRLHHISLLNEKNSKSWWEVDQGGGFLEHAASAYNLLVEVFPDLWLGLQSVNVCHLILTWWFEMSWTSAWWLLDSLHSCLAAVIVGYYWTRFPALLFWGLMSFDQPIDRLLMWFRHGEDRSRIHLRSGCGSQDLLMRQRLQRHHHLPPGLLMLMGACSWMWSRTLCTRWCSQA